ncbi:MAG TPA: LysR substrate-binding domain-containing protein [Pseudonocardiaceae bacterium]|jgi:DNA-binding transcriptional LysR family regulator|nr:LysR substrate-binding domain-containing protein [Pseudonocardiaceae bacterium]
MELRHLEAFLAVADELHFGRAAARLHISQPSLSQRLQRLERAVGVRLVDRGPHRVALTAAGQAFRVEARRLLGDLRDAVDTARAVGVGHAGIVRVGFNYPAGRRVLPPTLRRLARTHPRLRSVLAEARSGPQLAGLAAGELDVALVFGTPAGHASRLLFRTSLMALVGAGHPLYGRREVSFAELAEHPCVLFRRELSPAAYDALTGCGVLDVVADVDDSMGTAMVVAAGAVVGFASATRAVDAAGMGLHAVALVDPEPTVDVSVAWDATPAAHGFLSCLAIA